MNFSEMNHSEKVGFIPGTKFAEIPAEDRLKILRTVIPPDRMKRIQEERNQ